MENPNYYIVIPANIRYEKRLHANSKLLYGEITSKENICATYEYFAELYNVSKKTVMNYFKQLENFNLITINKIKGETFNDNNYYKFIAIR